MEQITYTEAIGKTLANIWYRGRDMVLSFTDKTWVHCYISSGYERGDEEYEFPPFGELESHLMLKAGLITQDEHDVLRAKEREESEARTEALQRKQYEQLKAKFELSKN